MKSSLAKWVLAACLFGVILYTSIYLAASHGEGFKFVKERIASSSVVVTRFGAIKRITLDPVGGYKEKFVNANKSAYMTIDVVGEKGSATIKVFAKKTNGSWQILEASIDGQPVQLNN